MPTLIEELAASLRQVHGVCVEHGLTELLATLPVGNGRSQTVKVVCDRATRGPYHLLRLTSRACAARDYKIVQRALRTNAGNELGGLALDTSTDPPVIDVVYSLIAEGVAINDFVDSLYSVAGLADHIEERFEGRDEF
jgi:hypothetical protein